MSNAWLRGLIALVIIAAALAIAALMIKSRPNLPMRESEAVLPAVTALEVRPGPVEITITSRGTIEPKRDIRFSSEVAGRVIDVSPSFVEGGRVEQGETLLRVDPIDYEVARSDAQAALASARFALAEAKVVVMKAAIDEAEARVQAAEDRLRQAEDNLRKTRLVAPFDAVVAEKAADLGQFLQPGAVIARLLGTATVEVRLPVLSADVPLLRFGQAPDGSWPMARLSSRLGNERRSWDARLVRLEQRVDEETRVFYLVAEIDAPYDAARHGMPLTLGLFVEAEIPGRPIEHAVRLPRAALHPGPSVYLVHEGRLNQRPVAVRRMEDDSVVIDGGLNAGEQVLASRLAFTIDGMAVAVEPRDG